jgi:hypothetical protein
MVAVTATARISCRVEADASIDTFVSGGSINQQPQLPGSASRLNAEIPVLPGLKGRKIRARVILIEVTAGTPSRPVGARVWVPILRPERFVSYQVGAVGTYDGQAVKILRKVDGWPRIDGKQF